MCFPTYLLSDGLLQDDGDIVLKGQLLNYVKLTGCEPLDVWLEYFHRIIRGGKMSTFMWSSLRVAKPVSKQLADSIKLRNEVYQVRGHNPALDS